ncbi:hypothetical protein MP228_001944 [Amoeboaphelidium protococcarum]|nr:hypothetical protein MP228_001944 [Amoeboaphelidium protococcarum]
MVHIDLPVIDRNVAFTGLHKAVDHPVGADMNFIQDGIMVFLLVALIACTHSLLHRYLFQPLSLVIVRRPDGQRVQSPPPSPKLGQPRQNLLQQYSTNLWKCTTSMYKLVSYSVLFCLGLYALIGDNQMFVGADGHWLSDGWLIRGQQFSFDQWPYMRIRYDASGSHGYDYALSRLSEFLNLDFFIYTFNLISQSIRTTLSSSPILFHYQYALAYYIYSTILVAFNLEGPKQKDKLQMILHHLVTIALIVTSWYLKQFRIGCIILVLHDISDPIMELAKLSMYAQKQNYANGFFATFAAVFLVSRCVVFPLTVLQPCVRYLVSTYGYTKAMTLMPQFPVFLVLLSILQILHVYWGSLIVKMIYDALTKGNVGEDIRDEDE